MLRSLAVIIVSSVALVSASPIAAQSQTPKPGAIASPSAKTMPKRSLGHNVGIHSGSSSGPVTAADCNRRAAGMPGVGGNLGPDGASRSGTIVAVPIGSGEVTTATRRQQIAEACARMRH